MKPSEILKRLEVDAVLLPIRRGTKCPSRKEWQKLSFAETQDMSFQRSLKNAPAIGVLLGSASGGLCSIDFDDDDFLKRFLELNPKLVGTLRTTARRGANLWIVLDDTPPPSRKLVFEGAPVGEFRSTGNQTIIAGLHPEGRSYRRLVDACPLRLPYSAIRSSLSDTERWAVESLPDAHAEAFRICRDLMAHEDKSSPARHFFLSCNDLADRLALHPPQAQRILLVFESVGWIEITEKGTRHTKGLPGRASRYRWKLDAIQDT